MKIDVAKLRYNAYRATKRIFLGPVAGSALGRNICRTLSESRAENVVNKHIVDWTKTASACIQKYSFPDEFPPEFPRDAAFDSQFSYRLKDVFVDPYSGIVWIPEGKILQESVGSLPFLHTKRLTGILRKCQVSEAQVPLTAFPSFGYYHAIFENLASVLHSIEFVEESKIVLPRRHSRFIDSILDFVGIAKNRRLLYSSPIRISDFVLSPIWVNGGFIPPHDIEILRKTILPKIGHPPFIAEKIYISRSKSVNRPIENEKELECALKQNGFSIIHFEDFPFSDQMALIQNAKVILAPHGAGLSNLIAANPGTQVVEILSRNWFNTCFAKLAVQIGCAYDYVETENQHDSPGGGRNPSPPVSIQKVVHAISKF